MSSVKYTTVVLKMVIYCCLMELYSDLMDYKWDINGI